MLCALCVAKDQNPVIDTYSSASPLARQAPVPKVRISGRSQCLYDPSPDGQLCEQRLETHTCRHHRPVYINSTRGCYGSERSLVEQLQSSCTASMSKHLLLPPPLLTSVAVDLSDIDILSVDVAAATFEAEISVTLSWHDPRLLNPDMNPCGARWRLFDEMLVCVCERGGRGGGREKRM